MGPRSGAADRDAAPELQRPDRRRGGGSAGPPLLLTNPALIGATVYFQAAILDPGAVQGIALTNGLHVVIG